jgi:hypothetical protein
MDLTTITPCRCLYWLPPVPYADGDDEAAGITEKPLQLEYG